MQFCEAGLLYGLHICTDFKNLFVLIASLVLSMFLDIIGWLCKMLFQRETSFGKATAAIFMFSHFVTQDRIFSSCYQKNPLQDNHQGCLWLTVAFLITWSFKLIHTIGEMKCRYNRSDKVSR